MDPIEEIQQQIDELAHLKKLSEDATTPLEKELDNLQAKLDQTQKALDGAAVRLAKVEKDIDRREADFEDSYTLLAERASSYYKTMRTSSPLLIFFASKHASDLTKDLSYQLQIQNRDKDEIKKISEELMQLEKDKKQVEKDKITLAGLQVKYDEQAVFFDKEIKGARAYQADLSQQIAELSARQQEILAEKTGTFQTTVGDVPLADDPASRPDYNPGFSPAFAAFSFGAPHYKGLSQYGAFGRAKADQNYETILRAYYGGGIELKDVDVNTQISVDGYGSYSLEEYAKRIYEMPGSWGDEGGMEALKAQAVAARSYALARGGSICATESCQVFKPEPKGGNWEKAVNETAGKVIYANGQPFSTWYASTSGGYQESYSSNGYSTPGFWDTVCGNQGCWTGEAYEKMAGSPWFYKGWYKSRSGDSCGRSHPWLTAEEMADVINAWVVIVKNGQSDDRVTPQGACWGGNPYSIDDLKNKANSLSGAYSKVNGVSVSYATNGVTASVSFDTDKGSLTISGSELMKAFNLRAPGRIALKSGLFNVEKK